MLSLIAIDLPRFMACNGSHAMGGFIPLNQDTTVTDEGNAAHWLVEQVFKGHTDPYSLIDTEAPNGVFVTANMVEHCERYVADIKALGGVVEYDTSYVDVHKRWEIRSRLDHGAQNGSILYINDFKYGWKVVEPETNWTLLWHAIRWVGMSEVHVEEIVFRIYQPRPYHPLGNVREWRITRAELMVYWAQLEQNLLNPSKLVTTSDHCYKCPSRTQCPAFQIATMNSIDVTEKAFDSFVNNVELSYSLDQISRAVKVLEQAKDAYEELAESRIKAGQTVPEYSLQTDLGNKQWKKGLTPDIMKSIVNIDIAKKQLLTPNQAKQLGVHENVIEVLTERNTKGVKLVRVDEAKKAKQLLGKKA